MDETSELGDAVVPQYKFEWDDGSSRTTESLPEQHADSNENLAALGREDPECEVTLLGYQTE